MWQLEKHWGDFLGGHGQPRRLGEDRPGLCGLVAKAMLSPTPQPRLLPFPSLSILKGEEGREGKEGRERERIRIWLILEVYLELTFLCKRQIQVRSRIFCCFMTVVH